MKPRILFIAPLPPPVHGSAMVSQYIKDSKLLQEQYDCDFVNLSTSRKMDEIGKGGIRKVMRFVGAYLMVLGKLMTHRYALCYLAITCHGMGFLKDAPFVLLCKLFRRKVLIHQHNKGMSNCVDKQPYKWLLPLVYRNTTVMLLSWYLYEDIAQVVSREQVVICPNGIPSIFNEDVDEDEDEDDDVDEDVDDDENVDADARGASVAFPFGQRTLFATAAGLSAQRSVACNPYENFCSQLTANSQPTNEARVEGNAFTSTEQGGGKACVAGLTANTQQPTAHLLFLSNLIESKGIYVLLDACKVLRERGLSFACDFVGGESKAVSAATFREAIAERGLEDCVVYHGPQYGEAKHGFFKKADIFVQPTFDDCFPLTLVEAMQYGLPIVSTDVGAIPDMVKDGENGFVCQQRDVTSLATALEQLITNESLRTQMGKAGYERYCTTMTLEAFEQRFAEIMRSEAAR